MLPTLSGNLRLRPFCVDLLLALFLGIALNGGVLWRGFVLDTTPHAFAFLLLQALALLCVSLALLTLFRGMGRWAFRILASVLVVASVCASYYMTMFNVVIGYGVIISALTMDIDLNAEAVGFDCVAWMMVGSALPLWMIWRAARPDTRPWWKRAGGWGLVLGASLLIGVGALRVIKSLKVQTAKERNEYIASALGVIAHRYVPSNWLTALALYGHQQFSDWRHESAQLFSPMAHFQYTPTSSMDDTYVVFVLGETTRADHMGILGYARDTTPLLAQERNLVALHGRSCDTATKLSLRCMFVREHGTLDNHQRTLKERNVFYGLRALGFTSELFSLQSEVWFYSSINANKYEIREIIAADPANQNKRIDDMLLVDQLRLSLKNNPKGKHLVVLHTKGSHYNYSQRYPESFKIFMPECLGIDSPCNEAELVNAFDNSVRYVDYMLKNVFDTLRDKEALVFYISDHGESIGENNHFHATPRDVAPPEQFRVPVLIWASDRFLADPKRQQGFAALRELQARGHVVRHEEIFDSLLGCLGYDSPNGGINPRNNWCATPTHP